MNHIVFVTESSISLFESAIGIFFYYIKTDACAFLTVLVVLIVIIRARCALGARVKVASSPHLLSVMCAAVRHLARSTMSFGCLLRIQGKISTVVGAAVELHTHG